MRYYSTSGKLQGVFMSVNGGYHAVICPDFKTVIMKHHVLYIKYVSIWFSLYSEQLINIDQFYEFWTNIGFI